MAIFVYDTFSGESSNTPLVNHVGEIGAEWTISPDVLGLSVDAANSRVYAASTAARGNFASGVPCSEEYDVSATVFGRSNMGVVGRQSTTVNSAYLARFSTSAVQLYRNVTGTLSLLGSYSQNTDGPHAITLEIRNATKKVYVDGVERISSADNTITDAGRAGVRAAAASSAWLDAFLAEDLSAALTAPTLTAPTNLATGVALSPTFTWS